METVQVTERPTAIVYSEPNFLLQQLLETCLSSSYSQYL